MVANRLKITALVILLSAIMVAGFAGTSSAVPANPEPVEVSQPNGTKFKAYIRGDEFQSWVETEHGHTVVKNPKTKIWEYAEEDKDGNLVPSGITVDPGKAPPKDIPKHLKPKRNTEREKAFRNMLNEIRKNRPQK